MAASQPPPSPDVTAAYAPGSAADAAAETQIVSPFASGAAVAPVARAGEGVGVRIGPYLLVELLGEGGMGSVYLAEQEEPVRRTVALKVIKPGMDSAQVVARFRAELQALALMDHQNIAKVLDAGATAGGQPYFVMELVRGTPLTEYCDQRRLPLRARLELFIPICLAIQHAHQKGILHRDIKPSNVLVTEVDGPPVPKVIDFGLAKATEQDAAAAPQFTQCGVVVGTLEYMSPEQASLNAGGVDTRTDIYSLGVLLFELLTGTTPLAWQTGGSSNLIDMLRIIQEVEPPRPSTRLVSLAELPTIAAARQIDPQRLPRLFRRELDWILLKALEKDRERRYDSALAFAQDVQRFLADEPVLACPPSLSYQAKKFVRRYRGPLLAAALALLLLVAGLAVSVWQAVRATAAETLALEERDLANRARAAAGMSNFYRLTDERRYLLSQGLLRALDTLVPLEAAFETWPQLSRREFSQFVARCRQQHPEISSVTWVPRVAGPERPALEAAARAEGLRDFAFRDFNPDGTFTGALAAEREVYYPIVYIEPLTEESREILGMDSSNSPPRLRTLDQARDSGEMIASAPLILGEEKEGELGFLVMRPVYRNAAATSSERRESLIGFATVAFRIRDLVDRVLGDLAGRDVALIIYDDAAGSSPIYRNPPNASPDWGGRHTTHHIDVAGRRWRIEFVALPASARER